MEYLRGAAIDRAIDRWSTPFEGVVRGERLQEAGVAEGAIGQRLDCGRLIAMFPGVYLVGHRGLTARRLWWACVMKGGPGSALSKKSAAGARALLHDERPCEVWVAVPPTCAVRDVVGLVDWKGSEIRLHLHRSSALPRAGVEPKFGHSIPMLSVPDTIVDVAADAPADFDDVYRRAEFRRLTTDRAIRTVLKRGRPGAAIVRKRLEHREFGDMRFQNGFEQFGEALFEVFGLARPLVNYVINVGGKHIRVDLYWPELGLVIELDGGGAHGSIGGRALDRSHEALLRSLGLDVMRFDWNQVMHRPAEIRAALVGCGYLSATTD